MKTLGKQFDTVIFDFDGVMSHDFFYANMEASHPAVYKFIQEEVFGPESTIPDKWMRGELSSRDVNEMIAESTDIDLETLEALFVKSVKDMRVDERLLEIAKELVTAGKKVALVTNNMDVFNEITIANHQLDKIFPVIVASHAYGYMKHDMHGKLYDIAMEKLGVADYASALLIDDSAKARATFETKGGTTYAFETFEEFEKWASAIR